MRILSCSHPSPNIDERPSGGARTRPKTTWRSSFMPLAGKSGSTCLYIHRKTRNDGILCPPDGNKSAADPAHRYAHRTKRGRRRRACLARGATWHIAGETTGGWRGALGRRFALFDDRRQYDTEPCRAVCSAFFPFQQLIAWGWRTLCPWRLAWWPRRRLPSGPRWRGSWRCATRLGRSCIAIELHERPPCHFDAFL